MKKKHSRKNMSKTYDLVDPKTWKVVETITCQELLDRLGKKFLSNDTEIDGLIITEY